LLISIKNYFSVLTCIDQNTIFYLNFSWGQ